MAVIAVVLVVAAVFAAVNDLTSVIAGTDKTRSTRARDKIETSITTPGDYIIDMKGLIKNQLIVEKSFRGFFNKTGVAPFVVVVGESDKIDGVTASDSPENLYHKMFSDEGHFLIIIVPTGDFSCKLQYFAGSEAAGFMDDEAVKIIDERINFYLNKEDGSTKFSDYYKPDEALSKAFDECGSRLMKVETNYVLYITIGVGVLIVVLIVVSVAKRKKKKGKLTVDKEYLPGEFVPQSVIRQSDTDNLGRGVKYRYGSESVAGDLPMGTLMNSDMLRSCLKDQPKAEMDSVYIPKGTYVNFSSPVGEMDAAVIPGTNRPYTEKQGSVSYTRSTLQYRDNKGNYVYQNSNEKTDATFESFAERYNKEKAQTAFNDEPEGFGARTAVYRDGKGESHLQRNMGQTDESFDSWAENYRKTMGQSAFVDEGDPFAGTAAAAPVSTPPPPPAAPASAEDQLKKWSAYYNLNTPADDSSVYTDSTGDTHVMNDIADKDKEWEKSFSEIRDKL